MTIYNDTDETWSHVEVILNQHFRIQPKDIEPDGIVQAPLVIFVAGYGQRFNFKTMQIKDPASHGKTAQWRTVRAALRVPQRRAATTRSVVSKERADARLKSELEVLCPCCQSVLVIDLNLGRVVSHSEPDRGNKPELSDAQRILAEERRGAKRSSSSRSTPRRPGRRAVAPVRGSAEAGRTRSRSRSRRETSTWTN
jgi:hypothetical protein